MRTITRLLVVPLLSVTLAPAGSAQAQSVSANTPADAAMPVSVRWNRLVPRFVDQNAASRRAARKAATATGDSATLRRLAQTPPPFLFRIQSLLSVAQYAAVNSVRENRAASVQAAVASASATVLAQLFTDSSVRASIAAELARDLDQATNSSRGGDKAMIGKRIGEDVATRVIAWAPPPMQLVGPYKGTIPTGPGMWYSAKGMPPIGILVGQGRTWLLDSTSQFRPAAPPAYGSREFQSALDEVRRVGEQRTAEQTAIAQKWNSGDPWARWNEIASDALQRHHTSELEAARVLAVLNVAALDAVVACFEAKYHYWTIRPSQADSTIKLADSVDLPNFPSYPSGHACSAGAFTAVLEHFFPQERATFKAIADEQAMSRLYGGIHFRFDNDGGVALGRTVANYVIERERKGGLNGWRDTRVAGKP